ncbi:MAG: hypothetical protein ACI9OJ_005369 [Myxococcota bacterium]|jgi:hypothetical protein
MSVRSLSLFIRPALLAPTLTVLLLAGCPDDEEDGEAIKPLVVNTELSETQIAAGAAVTVTCSGSRGDVVQSDLGFSIDVDPVDGWSPDGGALVVTRAGSYSVACRLSEPDPDSEDSPIDETPETLIVVAGAAATAGPWVDPSPGVAGESADAGCRVQDAHGNTIDGLAGTLEVSPTDGVTVSDDSLTATRVGTYDIGCSFTTTPGVEVTNIQWPVGPGAPAVLILTLDPERDAYPTDENITVKAASYDAHNNRVSEDATLDSISLAPEESTSVNLPQFSASTGGTYTVSATSGDASGALEVLVDGQAPSIDVTFPERGLTKNGDAEVLVTGLATDNDALAQLLVNGEKVTPDQATGGFNTTVPLAYGVNTVAVEATDKAGNVTTTHQAVAWSDNWYSLSPVDEDADGIVDGLTIVLGQAVLDDGDHSEETVDDVATLVGTILDGLDFGALIPDPLGSFLGCDYHMQEFNIDDASLSMELTDGALLLDIKLTNFILRVNNSGGLFCSLHDGKEPGDLLDGTGPLQYKADVLAIDAKLTLAVENGALVPKIEITKIDSEGTYNVNIPIIGDLVDGFFNFFLNILKGIIADQLNDLFGGLIESFALDLPLELPALGEGDPSTLRLKAKPTSGSITKDALTIGLKTVAHAESPNRPHDVLGSISYSGCGPTEPLPASDEPMLIALHDDVLNQILFAVWEGGLLNQTLGAAALGDFDVSQFGITNLKVTLDARLPLIFNSCGGNDRIQIGDLYLDAEFEIQGNPTHIAFWIQGEAPVEFAVVQKEDGTTELGFNLQDVDPITLQLVLNEGFFASNEAVLIAIVKDQLLPQMLGSLAGGLGSFPLPEIDLSGLAEGLPEGLVLAIDVKYLATGGGTVRLHSGLK